VLDLQWDTFCFPAAAVLDFSAVHYGHLADILAIWYMQGVHNTLLTVHCEPYLHRLSVRSVCLIISTIAYIGVGVGGLCPTKETWCFTNL